MSTVRRTADTWVISGLGSYTTPVVGRGIPGLGGLWEDIGTAVGGAVNAPDTDWSGVDGGAVGKLFADGDISPEGVIQAIEQGVDVTSDVIAAVGGDPRCKPPGPKPRSWAVWDCKLGWVHPNHQKNSISDPGRWIPVYRSGMVQWFTDNAGKAGALIAANEIGPARDLIKKMFRAFGSPRASRNFPAEGTWPGGPAIPADTRAFVFKTLADLNGKLPVASRITADDVTGGAAIALPATDATNQTMKDLAAAGKVQSAVAAATAPGAGMPKWVLPVAVAGAAWFFLA